MGEDRKAEKAKSFSEQLNDPPPPPYSPWNFQNNKIVRCEAKARLNDPSPWHPWNFPER
jgi:hypothetical protein